MPEESQSPASGPPAGDFPDTRPDPSIENLRQILFRRQIEKIDTLEADLGRLERQMNDEEALVKMIAPVLGEAIRLRIRDARDEIIEALYPIIGKIVQRAVTEAVADLAHSLDAQTKRAFDFRLAWWRLRASIGGASEAQIRLRELLPFEVSDILLIHRESGLLLIHLRSDNGLTADTDLFSGMLTAIRDFSQDTLGPADPSGLGEITYGDQHILIETARYAYLAAIIKGTAPPGFRAEMRNSINIIESLHAEDLRSYNGDARALQPAHNRLETLVKTGTPAKLSANQKRFLFGALGLTTLLLVGCGLLSAWAWRITHQTPQPLIVYVQPTAAPTLPPTVTPQPTATATVTVPPTPLPTHTWTPVPTVTLTVTPAPLIGLILGNVWMHAEPSAASARLGLILKLGEQVEVLEQEQDWVRVRQFAAGMNQVEGWIPARWIGTTAVISPSMITPSATP